MLSLNVKGISNFLKRRTILAWCQTRNTATTFLQETNSKLVTEVKLKNEWGRGQRICSHGSPNSRGVAILVKNVAHSKTVNPLGKSMILKAAMKEKMRSSVYARNKDKSGRNSEKCSHSKEIRCM